MNTEDHAIPTLVLEQYLLDELDPKTKARLQRALRTDERLRQRLRDLSRSNEEILQQYPPQPVAAEVARRAYREKTARKSTGLRQPLWAVAVPVCLLLLWWLPFFPKPVEQRIKGDQPRLIVYRVVAGEARKIDAATMLQRGDILQIHYVTDDHYRYGMIVSIDGAGVVTRHFPHSDDTALRLNRETSLAEAFELDNAPEFERFYFITHGEKVDVDRVLEGVRKMVASADSDQKKLHLPSAYRQYFIEFKKNDSN